MVPSDETGYDTSGSLIRMARVASRRELLKSKRVQTTDRLPGMDEEDTRGRFARSSHAQLRGENFHLRRELAGMQEQVRMAMGNTTLLHEEIETIHAAHQQEIEQYQQHLRDMMDERNQMQEINQGWERRYQELYHSFQDAVEEEANKMVQEAAHTLVLAPEHTPALLGDVVKTLEAQVKQTEDQRTAELLAVMRQAQYKSELLEQDVARERNALAAEREHLHLLQANVAQQAQQRYKMERTRLRGRWTAGLTLVSILLFTLMVALELFFYSLHSALYITLFVPLAICMVLSYILAHLHTSGRVLFQLQAKPQTKPASTSAATQKAPAK